MEPLLVELSATNQEMLLKVPPSELPLEPLLVTSLTKTVDKKLLPYLQNANASPQSRFFVTRSPLAFNSSFLHSQIVDQESFPSEFQKKMLWRAVTGIAIVIIGALLVGLVWLSSTVLGYLQPVLVPVAVAGIIAYLLDPVVQWLQRKGISRLKGILIVFLSFLLFFGILLAFVGTKLSHQLDGIGSSSNSVFTESELASAKSSNLYGWIVSDYLAKDDSATKVFLENGNEIENPNTDLLERYQLTDEELAEVKKSLWKTKPIPQPEKPADDTSPEALATYQQTLQEYQDNDALVHLESSLARNNFFLTTGGVTIKNSKDFLLGWLSNSYGKILGFFGVLLGFAMVPIYLYYFLKESDSIKSHWQDYVPLKASSFKNEVVETLREINGYLISFFRGQVLVAFIDGILVGIALTLFGLNYGLLIGVVMALLGIIPFIGNILCLIPACIIAVIQGESEPWGLPQWGYVLCVVGIFIVVQQINSLVTAPKIVGDSVGLHPMTVIFSMLFWSLLLGGFLGALLAVPLTAAVKVIFRRYLWERKVEPTLPGSQASGG